MHSAPAVWGQACCQKIQFKHPTGLARSWTLSREDDAAPGVGSRASRASLNVANVTEERETLNQGEIKAAGQNI